MMQLVIGWSKLEVRLHLNDHSFIVNYEKRPSFFVCGGGGGIAYI